MLATTFQIVKSGLQADPSLTPSDRARLLALLRNGASATKPEPAAPNEPRLIRRREAAARLSCSLRTIDNLGAQGILQKRKLPGRQRSSGFLESDVTALITENEAALKIPVANFTYR